MRAWLLVAVLLTAPAGALSIEDPAGDVVLHAQGTSVPGDEDAADILLVEVKGETEDQFEVWVEKAAWPEGSGIVACVGGSTSTRVDFSFNGMEYAVFIGGGAALAVRNAATGEHRILSSLERMEDGQARGALVPKDLVTDRDGLPIRAGTSIVGIHAESKSFVTCDVQGQGTEVAYLDRAPETPHPDPFLFAKAPGSFGPITISTPAPVRASNGGPDAFVYPLIIENRGAPRELLLAAEDVPEDWDVRLPARVAVATQATVPVFVTTESDHRHGAEASFRVSIQDATSDLAGEYQLGIRYLEIPQLAGHHPTIFVHAGTQQFTTLDGKPATWNSWFNTLSEVDDDSGLDVYSSTADGEAVWEILMDPSLVIGLDFDVERRAALHLVMGHDLGAAYELDLELLHCNPGSPDGRFGGEHGCDRGSWHVLSHGTASVDLPADEAQEIVAELEVDAYSDHLPYVAGSNVMLRVVAPEQVVDPSVGPFIVSRDTYLTLPLNEFQDPVEAGLASGGSLSLTVDAREKPVNPGDSVWFRVSAASDARRQVHVQAIGLHADWIDIHPASGPVDGEAAFGVRVSPPAGAVAGEVADFFVVVEDSADASVAAVTNLRAVVVDEPVEESMEGSALQPGKKSPAAVPLALLVLAMYLRRRI